MILQNFLKKLPFKKKSKKKRYKFTRCLEKILLLWPKW